MNTRAIVSHMMYLAITVILLGCSVNEVYNNSEHDKLKADIAVIEGITLDSLNEFYAQNSEWIADVNTRIEKYVANSSEDQKDGILMELRGDNTTRSITNYFISHTYRWRDGYYTYSMIPKMSTRLLRSYATRGLYELVLTYPSINKNYSSLSDQYWCHFRALIEAEWDIEEGRPNVGFVKTCLAGCNP